MFQSNKNAIKYSLHSSKKSIFISESSTWIQCSILCLKKKKKVNANISITKINVFAFVLSFGYAGSLLLCQFFLSCSVWASHCGGFSVEACQLQSTWASVAAALRLLSTGSIVVMNALSCPVVCGTFPDQGSNLCLLQWQAYSLPLSHQGGPKLNVFYLYEKPHKDNT